MPTCFSCRKKVNNSHKFLDCAICNNLFHLTCIGGDLKFCDKTDAWYCPYCLSSILLFNGDDFRCALQSSYHTDKLNKLVFNPFCWNDKHTAESDFDPDVNFVNDITIESKYICESDAHVIYCNVNQKHFSLLHIICSSINKNITNIYTLLENV